MNEKLHQVEGPHHLSELKLYNPRPHPDCWRPGGVQRLISNVVDYRVGNTKLR